MLNESPTHSRIVNQLRHLAESSARVRVVVMELILSEGEAAVEPLCWALKETAYHLRAAAAEALQRIGAPAVESVCRILSEGDSDARRRAAQTLGEIGDLRAVEALCRAAQEEYEAVSRSEAQASGRREGESVARESGVPVRRAIIGALGRLGDARALPLLLRALRDKNDWVQKDAVEGLSRLGAPALDSLVSALQDPDYRVRLGAVTALGKLGDEKAVAPLLALFEDPNDYVREAVVDALGVLGDMRAVDLLLRAMQDSDPILRDHAAAALAQVGEGDRIARKLIGARELTAQEKIALWEKLAALLYTTETWRLPYLMPDLRAYSEQLRNDTEEAVREGARAMLQVLDGEVLLRASSRNAGRERAELMRPAAGEGRPAAPEQLVRPIADPPPAQGEKNPNRRRFRWPFHR